jgi:lysozyme family protein
MSSIFQKSLYTVLWFETGGRFDPTNPGCINGTDPSKCGTSGGKNDRGGVTKYGVAQKFHPDIDVTKLDLAGASNIYYNEYWLAAGCDKFTDRVAAYVFDIATNSGVKQGDKLLQMALGVVADSKIGPATIAAEHEQAKDLASETEIINKMLSLRLNFYNMIIQAHPEQREFLNGWSNRARNFMSRFDTFN